MYLIQSISDYLDRVVTSFLAMTDSFSAIPLKNGIQVMKDFSPGYRVVARYDYTSQLSQIRESFFSCLHLFFSIILSMKILITGGAGFI